MKKLFITLAFIVLFTFTSFAQVNRTANTTITPVNPLAKQAVPEGHYCDYCKQNYPESHFPCIMKSIKGKVDATGKINFTEGQPIGGIVVKGGKNPGGNLMMVTNSNGEIEINNATAGNYKFAITVPSADPQSRTTGNPIGGIIVKGGKNPGGGNSIVVITNENGEIELNNLAAGNYKFTVMGATASEKSNPLYKSSHTVKENPLYKEN